MVESTLSVDYTSLRKDVGHYLGYRRDISKWDTDKKDEIDAIIRDGLLQFYNPFVEGSKHEWSFLKPEYTVTTVADTSDYDMPDDFNGIVGNKLTFAYGESNSYVTVVSINMINRYRQGNNQSNVPVLAAVKAKTKTTTTGQRYALEFYPTPDAVYNITFQYYVIPGTISATNPYPYGGAVHSQTIRESCLAVAELQKNDEIGPHHTKFNQLLAVSISHDKRNQQAVTLGNVPGWQKQVDNYYRRNHGNYVVTVQGITPS